MTSEKTQPWIEKYRPKFFTDVKGQAEAIEKIKEFISVGIKNKKAILLHGPPGVGKTTLAHVTANEINSEVFELNASDLRNKAKLKEILKPAIEQRSLTKEDKIILIDEVDGISGYQDRGGITELISLVEDSKYPIIITANDVWSKKFSSLRKKCEAVQLKEVDYKTIKDILILILRKEKNFVDNDILTNIAIKAKGDLRAATNDLQMIASMDVPSAENLSERNKETDIFNALKLVFKGKPTNDVLRIYDEVKMPLDEIILWVEENIPLEYKGEALARAYDLLSKVDLFKGRIYKKQYWRFMVYENIFLSYGISSSKGKEENYGFTSYKKPTRILKIWMNNQRTMKKKSIAKKYAAYVHIGVKRAMQEFPLIKNIIKSNEKIAKELKINEEELSYLKN